MFTEGMIMLKKEMTVDKGLKFYKLFYTNGDFGN